MARRQLLLVDDDPLVRKVMEAMLDRLGFEVDAVGDAETAWERLAAGADAYAFALVDQGLGEGESGLAFCERVHEAFPGLPLLMASGNPVVVPDYMVASLQKPLRREKLREVLHRHGLL